jgi:transcriptional antiterminator NusG
MAKEKIGGVTMATSVFKINEAVKIISGSFANFFGTIKSINPDGEHIVVNAKAFGRITPIELENHQVEKI